MQVANKLLKDTEYTTDLPHFTDKTVLGALEELSTGKANTSGEYNGLISGQANALKPSARLENSTPYLFRPSFSNGYGYETLIGGTCCVNQLVNLSGSFGYDGGSGVIDTTNHTITVTISEIRQGQGLYQSFNVIGGHKYLIMFSANISKSDIPFYGRIANFGNTNKVNSIANTDIFVSGIISVTSSSNTSLELECDLIGTSASVGDNYVIKNPMLIDLTAMFGTTIADYVYTLESGTSGAGITWLKNNGFFNEAYYPYNAGALLSVKTSKKINRDADNNVIGEYTLDDIELRGILKLDGSNNLYYDGDTYSSSGEVVRKYGTDSISTLDIMEYTNIVYARFAKPNISVDYNEATSNIFTIYPSNNAVSDWDNADKVGYIFGGASFTEYWIGFPAGTTLPQMYSALNDLPFVFKLATPTTEIADTFTNPMIVDGNGTEQFVDGRTVEMPVGHSTIYVDDNDATKLENLPDISNDGNGTYLVTQNNGQMSLDKYPIPNPPTTDGSYRLEVTVTDGVPSYTWEVIS